jgi:hypothetical protein
MITDPIAGQPPTPTPTPPTTTPGNDGVAWSRFVLRLVVTAIAFGAVWYVWRRAVDGIDYDASAFVARVKDPVEGLTIFAVFFVAAAGIERFLEPVASIITAVAGTSVSDLTKTLFWGFATCIGIVASASLELYLLRQVGIASPPRELDVLATGLIIGAGTKPLHDLTKLIEKKKETAAATASAAAAAG